MGGWASNKQHLFKQSMRLPREFQNIEIYFDETSTKMIVQNDSKWWRWGVERGWFLFAPPCVKNSNEHKTKPGYAVAMATASCRSTLFFIFFFFLGGRILCCHFCARTFTNDPRAHMMHRALWSTDDGNHCSVKTAIMVDKPRMCAWRWTGSLQSSS